VNIPETIRLIKKPDFLYSNHPRCYRIELLEVGEIGKYFKEGDCYNFSARNGFVPYVNRSLALNNHINFEIISD
jgi:hypothetical protein